MARYAVGDIQGCFDSLLCLLGDLSFSWQKDELWCVGDLINRGPKSLETLRFLYAHRDRVTCVLGNHDLHFLAVYYGLRAPSPSDTLTALLQADDAEELVNWLRGLPLCHYDSAQGLLLAHAGIAPHWSPEQAVELSNEVSAVLRSDAICDFLLGMYGNEPSCWDDELEGVERLRCITNYFTRMRFCREDGELDLISKEGSAQAPDGFLPWFEFLPRDYPKVVFGHWAALEGKSTVSNAIALDTGCVWGNQLTAINLDTGLRTACDCPTNQALNSLFATKRGQT